MERDRSTVGGPDPTFGGPAPAGHSSADSSDEARDPQRRRSIIVSLVVVAVLVLVVAIGGSILAYRALSPEPGADKGAIIEGSEILETMGGTAPGPLTVGLDSRTVPIS